MPLSQFSNDELTTLLLALSIAKTSAAKLDVPPHFNRMDNLAIKINAVLLQRNSHTQIKEPICG